MPILNYTTKISADKTASEIQRKLAEAKAKAILCEYDDDTRLAAMSFQIVTIHGIVSFRLPVNVNGVYRSLQSDKKVTNKYKTKDQATRVAWRILKDWVEAQLAIVEAEMVELTEVFLPYAQNKEGQTVYQALKDNQFKSITFEK